MSWILSIIILFSFNHFLMDKVIGLVNKNDVIELELIDSKASLFEALFSDCPCKVLN